MTFKTMNIIQEEEENILPWNPKVLWDCGMGWTIYGISGLHSLNKF